jgi:membrane-bound metal-dependent hydrolase YbcI (DUF457 family)
MRFFKIKLSKLQIVQLFCLLHVILQILDGSFTYWGISNFGVRVEGNPFIVLLVDQFGLVQGLLMAKLSGIGFIGIFYHIIKTNLDQFKTLFFMLGFVNIVYGVVVAIWFTAWLFPENFMPGPF